MLLLLFIATLLFSAPGQPLAQPTEPPPAEPLYYVTRPEATVYTAPRDGKPYLKLHLREQVYLLEEEGGWARVKTMDGAEGYLMRGHLSNVWMRISKKSQTLFVYRGPELIEKFPVDLGYNYFADKERRGSMSGRDHWRTPEGQFFVVSLNGRSQYHKAFVLNYPTPEDAESGLKKGLISRAEHAAIVSADRKGAMPPMNTALGGWIEIHGNGTGARSNWTQGCIALKDQEIDRLWDLVQLGAPVLIEP